MTSKETSKHISIKESESDGKKYCIPDDIVIIIIEYVHSGHRLHEIFSIIKWAPDFFSNRIRKLDLSYGIITDKRIDNVSCKLPNLTSINFSECYKIDDNCIKYLSKLYSLRKIDLSRCINITDNTIKCVTYNCTNITNLNLSGCTNITDRGIQYISKLTSLQTLDLSHCILTDTSIQNISELTRLKHLYLRSCNNITDKGIKNLVRLSSLYMLDLGMTKITKVSLQDISKMTGLRVLELQYCNNITESDVHDLLKLSTSKQLHVLLKPNIIK